MNDLNHTARLFDGSSRLGRAAEVLRDLLAGLPPDRAELDLLGWAGDLLACLDLEAARLRGPRSGELAVQAADLRPTFYFVLQSLVPDLAELGVTTPEELQDFLGESARFLAEGGAPEDLAGRRRVTVLAELLQAFSDRLAGRVHRNGVPSPHWSRESQGGA